jgi:hypothetical protein
MAKITVGPIRISYAYLFTPRPAQTPGQQQKYGATILIPKNATASLSKLQETIELTKQNYLAANPKATWIKNAKTTMYDGDGLRPGGEEFGDEAKGHWVISASNHRQPMVVDQAKQPIMNADDVYSGCFGLAVLDFYVYDKAGNKGIACSLQGFMKTADGEPLGGSRVSDNDWNNVAADDLAQLNAMLA